MRKSIFRLGWGILVALPVIYGTQIYIAQDLPPVEPWKWLILLGTVAVIYFTRNKDDVLKHHVIARRGV